MGNQTTRASSDDAGKLVLRLTLGVLLLFHGYAKLTGSFGFIEGVVGKAGLPHFVAYLVFLGEVVGPVLVILGLWTRIGGLLIMINMLFAIFLVLVHRPGLFSLAQGGGWSQELSAFFLLSGLAVSLLGAGRYSVGGSAGRWN
ncbi:MAG TPA: DoxX family protein [Casimicrobiaceae bacterium]|nr:DoxX family protein [Casimicrobiaceae bacterium]